MRRAVVIGCGAYLPARVVTNEEISRTVDTTDEWIIARTGIRQRHFAAEDEQTSDLAVKAARKALAAADLENGVDLILLATTTPDSTFPATATRVQAKLGLTGGAAFDIQAVCAGFVFGLATANAMVQAGQCETALVIGADTFSRILDWKDRRTCVLFGDGAGAVVLRAETGAGTSADRGILSTHIRTDGRYYDLLYVDGGVSSTQRAGFVRMEGQEVFRHAIEKLSSVLKEAMAANGLGPKDIDWFVPHQANKRIIDGMARKLRIPNEKVIVTVARHANTSAASIPLALCDAVLDGRIKKNDVILLEAIGGGLAWGACVLRW